jgi:hypothetical protein
MAENFIPIARPQFGPAEETAVLEVMRSGVFAQGPRVRAFEEAFAAEVGSRYAVAVASGTAALNLTLLASDIGPGDEVSFKPEPSRSSPTLMIRSTSIPKRQLLRSRRGPEPSFQFISMEIRPICQPSRDWRTDTVCS